MNVALAVELWIKLHHLCLFEWFLCLFGVGWCVLVQILLCMVKCFFILVSDNWSVKAIRRKTTGTGRMRYLRHLPRRFKSNFREGILLYLPWQIIVAYLFHIYNKLFCVLIRNWSYSKEQGSSCRLCIRSGRFERASGLYSQAILDHFLISFWRVADL